MVSAVYERRRHHMLCDRSCSKLTSCHYRTATSHEIPPAMKTEMISPSFFGHTLSASKAFLRGIVLFSFGAAHSLPEISTFRKTENHLLSLSMCEHVTVWCMKWFDWRKIAIATEINQLRKLYWKQIYRLISSSRPPNLIRSTFSNSMFRSAVPLKIYCTSLYPEKRSDAW